MTKLVFFLMGPISVTQKVPDFDTLSLCPGTNCDVRTECAVLEKAYYFVILIHSI